MPFVTSTCNFLIFSKNRNRTRVKIKYSNNNRIHANSILSMEEPNNLMFTNYTFYIPLTCVLSVISMAFSTNLISCCVILPKYLGTILCNQQTFFFLLPLSRATVFTSRTSLSINVCCLERKFRRFCQSAFPFNNVCKETTTTYIKVNTTFIDKNALTGNIFFLSFILQPSQYLRLYTISVYDELGRFGWFSSVTFKKYHTVSSNSTIFPPSKPSSTHYAWSFSYPNFYFCNWKAVNNIWYSQVVIKQQMLWTFGLSISSTMDQNLIPRNEARSFLLTQMWPTWENVFMTVRYISRTLLSCFTAGSWSSHSIKRYLNMAKT